MLWLCEGAAPQQLFTEGRRFRGGLLVGAGALLVSGENGCLELKVRGANRGR